MKANQLPTARPPRNPFTPTFGVTPPLLAGRDAELRQFSEALADGPGSPGRAILVTGARGSGKTVLLNAIEQAARAEGWLVVAATARPGIAHELATDTLPALLAEHDPNATTSRVTGAGANALGFGASISREVSDHHSVAPAFRSQLARLARLGAAAGGGVLLTVDEVNHLARDDLREIAQGVQHAFREGLEVAFVAAALPAAAHAAAIDPVITFLRRAERFTLGRVADGDVAAALAEPIAQAGRSITPPALELAVAATRGYPFFVQVVGHQVWAVDRAQETIDLAQARTGRDRAVQRAHRLLHEPALAEVSRQDRAFLAAMAADDGPSQMSVIAARLGVSAGYASRYRGRLIDAELIEPAGRGLVRFTIPFLGEYLRRTPPS
jgi:energy-coupling factor transporter ATP-binding protein EcfA2